MISKLCPMAVKPLQCIYHLRLLSVIYKIIWYKNGAAAWQVLLFMEWCAAHHPDPLQSVVCVWDLNCILHICEYDDTGFKIVVVEKLWVINMAYQIVNFVLSFHPHSTSINLWVWMWTLLQDQWKFIQKRPTDIRHRSIR